MNNQNFNSHLPNQQISLLKKKIDLENQKSLSHDQRIKELKNKIEIAKNRTQQKKQHLLSVQRKILQEKQKQNQFESSNSSSQTTSNLSTSLTGSSSQSAINQLREHFKALRQMMLNDVWGSQQDDEDDYYDQVDVDNMTYEELLELGDKIGKVSKGLDMKKMQSLQVKKYHNQNPNQQIDCAICRDELTEGADCIQLHCHHVFHDECIKGWLNVQKHCPNCKRQIKIGAVQNTTAKN